MLKSYHQKTNSSAEHPTERACMHCNQHELAKNVTRYSGPSYLTRTVTRFWDWWLFRFVIFSSNGMPERSYLLGYEARGVCRRCFWHCLGNSLEISSPGAIYVYVTGMIAVSHQRAKEMRWFSSSRRGTVCEQTSISMWNDYNVLAFSCGRPICVQWLLNDIISTGSSTP